MPLLIKNGQIVTPSENYNADIFCEDQTITKIGKNLDAPPGTTVIDAGGKYVFPGFIDPHVHIYLPFMGTFAKDTYETASKAALIGGTTTLIEMVCPSNKEQPLEASAAVVTLGGWTSTGGVASATMLGELTSAVVSGDTIDVGGGCSGSRTATAASCVIVLLFTCSCSWSAALRVPASPCCSGASSIVRRGFWTCGGSEAQRAAPEGSRSLRASTVRDLKLARVMKPSMYA